MKIATQSPFCSSARLFFFGWFMSSASSCSSFACSFAHILFNYPHEGKANLEIFKDFGLTGLRCQSLLWHCCFNCSPQLYLSQLPLRLFKNQKFPSSLIHF